jgi:site-specific DNA-methyltransferase (adenine-specific)
MYKLYNDDNLVILNELLNEKISVDTIYGDMIYENPDFTWVDLSYELLKSNGVFYVQLDYHLAAEMKIHLDYLFGKENFINWITTVQEWGGIPKKGFPRKTDFILMYSKGKDFKWYPERIRIKKATAGTKFDKKGTGLKTPCDCFYDLGNFSTMSKERIKFNDKNIQWQKMLSLMNRLLYPVTDENDLVGDFFLGSGTTGVWCKQNKRDFIGIENNLEVFNLAKNRIENS